MTFDINLQWQTFSVDLPTVDAWMKANAGANYCGLSGNSMLQVHFTSDPGSDVAAAVEAYWAGLSTSSPEATNYPISQQKAIVNAKIVAARQFGSQLMNQFETENVIMGINADNMVDSVLDTMAPVMSALQAGSLTSVVRRIKAVPTGSYDSKYVTAARLLSYCNQVETFLGVTLSTSLS